MPPVKRAGTSRGAGRSATPKPPKLPPVTVARLEETGRLLERLVATNQSVFVERGQAYKDIHRKGASRPLSALESAQIAAALDSEDKIASAEQVQQSELRAYDEPDSREILVAAGLAVAPAFVEALRQVVALVELDATTFEQACEDDTLDQVVEGAADELRNLELGDMRTRAAAAMAHYARSAGFEPGEAWGLPVQAVWQALQTAMGSLVDASASSQLTGSAESTEGSPGETSSTGSDGPKPSS